MGKAEKIAVLSTLFLVVALFVWSLGGETKTVEEQGGREAETAQQAPVGAETFARRPPAANVETADIDVAGAEGGGAADGASPAPFLDVAAVEPGQRERVRLRRRDPHRGQRAKSLLASRCQGGWPMAWITSRPRPSVNSA